MTPKTAEAIDQALRAFGRAVEQEQAVQAGTWNALLAVARQVAVCVREGDVPMAVQHAQTLEGLEYGLMGDCALCGPFLDAVGLPEELTRDTSPPPSPLAARRGLE